MKTRSVFVAILPALLMLGMFLPSFASAQLDIQPTPPITAISSTPVQATSGISVYYGYYGYYRGGSEAINNLINQLPPVAAQILPIPILFGISPSDIFPNFGDPRSGGRTHEGEDIMAPRNALIVSPTQAVVIEVGTGYSSGNFVSTANPEGEKFVYMHLEKMSTLNVGDPLQPGDLIGYVGNTGDASGGATHLHFEIRKNGATDPFPRLKGEFPLAQKISFAANIISRTTDKAALAQLLVTMYRGQFISAQAAGIALPSEITAEMLRVPTEGLGTVATPASGDLTLGSRGTTVIALQNFLILQNRGPAAHALSNAGPTGNFGPITASALMEYQAAVGITPADGYYGPVTRAYVQNAPSPAVVPVLPAASTTTVTTTVTTTSISVPARDLTLGARGADVILLQTFLISMQSGPGSTALAAAGATGYFGSVTRAALAEYQLRVGITPAVGYFGALTRARMTTALGI